MPDARSRSPVAESVTGRFLEERTTANRRFFEAEAARLADLCRRFAERFARGGRRFACGCTPAARSDVRHVAVEFVHPVSVGKRALPAIGLTGGGGLLAAQLEPLIRPDDMLIAFGADEPDPASRDEVEHAIDVARRRGLLTVAFGHSRAEHVYDPPSMDPFIRQELVETLYHVLWELVHVFFEHRGLLSGRTPAPRHEPGGASFLYPFLSDAERDLDAVLTDVRRSILMKARDAAELRSATLEGSWPALSQAAASVTDALGAGGTLLALGNGGSATDAMDLVADLRAPPAEWPARAALDLGEDAGIVSAIAHDVGADAIFARQVVAYGKEGDVVVAFTTSGGSRNVILALAEARRRGLRTVAFTGCDGGRIAAEGLADHVILSPSRHIPRIQEAQAAGYHVLRTLVELPMEPD